MSEETRKPLTIAAMRGHISDLNKMTQQNNEANKNIAKLCLRNHSILQTALLEEYARAGFVRDARVNRVTGKSGKIVQLIYDHETCDLSILFAPDGVDIVDVDGNIHPIVQFILE